jgi:hypothetical protein
MVGFTGQKGGNEKSVAISRSREEIKEEISKYDREVISKEGERIEIKGFLKFADSTKTTNGVIRIITSDSGVETIYVPLGLMSDLVRPLYESEVVVNAVIDNRGLKRLITIEPA